MSEYRHTVSRTELRSASQSPPQRLSNSGNAGFDKSLTVKNGLTAAVGLTYGLKLGKSIVNTAIDQTGSDKLKDASNLAAKGFGYLAIGVATPQLLPFVLTVDAINAGIERAIQVQEIRFENERISKTRGVIRSSAGGYYG